jgi:hypothetical protein
VSKYVPAILESPNPIEATSLKAVRLFKAAVLAYLIASFKAKTQLCT